MFTVAMETPTNMVNMPFCIIFDIFSAFSEKLNFNTASRDDQHQTSVTSKAISTPVYEKLCVGWCGI